MDGASVYNKAVSFIANSHQSKASIEGIGNAHVGENTEIISYKDNFCVWVAVPVYDHNGCNRIDLSAYKND